MKTKVGRALVALTLLVPLLVFGVVAGGPAQAAYNPCGQHTPGQYGGGTQTTGAGTAIEGVSGNLTYRTDALCTSDLSSGNAATSWDMITGNAATDGYAQSGQIYWYALGCERHFAQQSEFYNSLYLTKTGSCASPGEVHTVWTSWFPSCVCLQSIVDTTIFLVAPWNPYGNWHLPFIAQWFGESPLYYETDIPGTPTSSSMFTNMGIQLSSSNSSTQNCFAAPLPTDTYETSPRYSATQSSCSVTNFWTH